jgi:hypothetical protein
MAYIFTSMPYIKEKRIFERIPVPNAFGLVEAKGLRKDVSIINACTGGMCISGAAVPIGTVVRLYIDQPEFTQGKISLYCKVVWAEKNNGSSMSGLAILNTNRILFERDLEYYGKMLEAAVIDR